MLFVFVMCLFVFHLYGNTFFVLCPFYFWFLLNSYHSLRIFCLFLFPGPNSLKTLMFPIHCSFPLYPSLKILFLKHQIHKIFTSKCFSLFPLTASLLPPRSVKIVNLYLELLQVGRLSKKENFSVIVGHMSVSSFRLQIC